MKKSLKLLVLPAAMVLIAGNATSCSPSQKEIAMISDVGDIDDGSFNQGCWEAVQNYGKTNNKSYDYYRPFADSDFARDCAIKQAVVKGAKFIILPGFKFCTAASKNSALYPDVKFLLLDSTVSGEIPQNLIQVNYDFIDSGWLAGYTVCKDYMETDWHNNQKLANTYGFAYYGGMPYGTVYPYGYGFIEGILYAAQEFTTNPEHIITDKPFININYAYANVFMQDDLACSTVKGWLNSTKEPVECVFSCGGKLYQSVTEAVKHYNQHSLPSSERNFEDQHAPRNAARWIGVDADQYELVQDYDEKKSIYTSALKDCGHTIKVILDYFYQDKWDIVRAGGQPGLLGSYVLGLQSSFVQNPSSIPEDKAYDYVGIIEKFKDDPVEENTVLKSYNYVTKADLDKAVALLSEDLDEVGEHVIAYQGLTPEFSEKAGFPTFFNSDSYLKSQYNIPLTDNEIEHPISGEECKERKYPSDNYRVNVI